jgi:Leucine-rich repeat (LRR) protein
MDKHLKNALKAAVGHDAPFTAAELGSVTTLEISRAEDLAGLEKCTGLEKLTLFALDAAELDCVGGLKKLKTLRIGCVGVTDLSPIAKLSALTELTVNFTGAADASAILSLKSLEKAELLGNPWDDKSYEKLARSSRPKITLSPEAHWKLTRQLSERGLQLTFGNRAGAKPALVLCKAGVQYVADYAETTEKKVIAALARNKKQGDLDTDEFLEDFELTQPKDAPIKHLLG